MSQNSTNYNNAFNMSRTPCALRRIIQLKEAMVFQPIKITNASAEDITQYCQYSWSTDGVCWSPWVEYSQYLKICKYLDSDFYFRILIFDSLGQLLLSGQATDCYSISLDTTNVFLQDFCNNPNLFQPYNNLDCALLLQQQLSNTVICMFGVPVYYIRVLPQEESVDYTFKEWVLHNAVDIKQLKMMIPDGTMPSSNPKLTEFDFDWETDWEVHIGKASFASAFGDTAFPKQRDLVYVPLMKRLWEVNSAYDEKNEGLLWRPTTWHLSLVKYNEKTNVNTEDFSDIIDNWIDNKYEDVFGEFEDNEQERESTTPQVTSPTFAATNLYNIFSSDSVRNALTIDSINIIDNNICHHSNIVSYNIYKPKSFDATVEYQKGICGDQGMLTFIINTTLQSQDIEDKPILKFGSIDIRCNIVDNLLELTIEGTENRLSLELNNTYLVLVTWDVNNFTISFEAYKHTYDESLPKYKVRPEMCWFDFENPLRSISAYNNDWTTSTPQKCSIMPWPVLMTNVKYYNRVLRDEELYKELVKYTTDDKRCVFADLARPVLDGHGYAVR